MNCEICSKNFNHDINKPLMLINCGHTICAECESNAEKKCPHCKAVIERTLFNSILVLTSTNETKSVCEPITKRIKRSDSDQEIQASAMIKNEPKEEKIILNNYNNVNTLRGHTSLVTSLVFLPNSGYLVSGDKTGEIRIWNIIDDILIMILNHPPEIFSLLAASHDNFFVSSNKTNTIIWNSINFRKEKTINTGGAFSYAYNSENHVLAIGSYDVAEIWHKIDFNWKKIKTIKTHEQKDRQSLMLSLVFLPNGMLAIGGKDNDKISILSTITCKLLRKLNGHSSSGRGHIKSLVVISNKTFASAGGLTIKIWDIDSWQTIQIFEGKSHFIENMILLPFGRLATFSNGNTIRIWDETGETIQILNGHLDFVKSLAVSSNGLLLVSGSQDKTITIWKQEEL